MPRKMAIVIELDDVDDNGVKAREILDTVKPLFADRDDVKVYGAVRETAEAIHELLNM